MPVSLGSLPFYIYRVGPSPLRIFSLFQRGHANMMLACVVLPFALTGCTPELIGRERNSTGPSGLSYTYMTGAFVTLRAAPTNSPTLTSGSATSYSISPALPTGMSINSSTGVISGTPSVDSPGVASNPVAYTTYTVTASNSAGSTTAALKLLFMGGYYVNDTSNAADTTTADGACLTGGGTCTVPAAMTQANFTGGKKLILLAAGTYTNGTPITPGAGLTDLITCGVNTDTSILSGGGTQYIWDVSNNTNIKLCNLTLRDGSEPVGSGAGFYFSPGVAKTLEISYVKFISNVAASFAGGAYIGAGPNHTVTIDHTEFDSNISQGGGNGGGGMSIDSGTVTITDSTFKNNQAQNGSGGGIYQVNTAVVTAVRTTFSNNSAQASGGGVITGNTSAFNCRNCTFSGNSAATGDGGAISYSAGNGSSVSFSTFYNNSSPTGAVDLSNAGTTLTMTANLFDSNTLYHCFDNTAAIWWVNGGYSIYKNSVSNDNCFGTTNAGTGDVAVASTGLNTTLALNGGTVQNHALNTGSSAINYVPLAACTLTNLGGTLSDTRGYSRPSGATCDVGSYEK